MHQCGARASHHDRRLSWRRWRTAAGYRASAGKRKQDQSGKSTGARGCRVELGRHDGGERCRSKPLWQARAISGTRALMKRLLAILACARLTAASPQPIPHWTSYPARLRVAGWPGSCDHCRIDHPASRRSGGRQADRAGFGAREKAPRPGLMVRPWPRTRCRELRRGGLRAGRLRWLPRNRRRCHSGPRRAAGAPGACVRSPQAPILDGIQRLVILAHGGLLGEVVVHRSRSMRATWLSSFARRTVSVRRSASISPVMRPAFRRSDGRSRRARRGAASSAP